MSIHDELPSWRSSKACAEKSNAATARRVQNAAWCWNKDLDRKPVGRGTRLERRVTLRYIEHTRGRCAMQDALDVG